jgi:hypothetical protein
MSWIKRNLYFLIGGIVAVALLGVAGFYFYSKWSLKNESQEKLDAAYADWERISNLNPSPGNDKVNNIQLARDQRAEVNKTIAKVQKFFAPISPIPNPENGPVTKEEFASSLRRTIDQLQKEASSGGVTLPPRYDFSFQAERNLPNFAQGSLPPLSAQLGDIRTICNILFKAKVNALDAVRRERVSSDDQNGPQTDYLEPTHVSVTNELAVLVPYEVSFQSFSAELAAALSGFGADEHGIIVKAVNVEPLTGSGMLGVPGGPAPYGNPAYPGAPGYGNPGGYYGNPELRGMAPPVAPTAAPATRGGLQTILDEKPLKVTLVLNVVRLLPKK